ncbi:ABC transporter ATP-binding protein [Desulfobaculum bizertense]|uniref:Heme exporter protein A n=1 Tax=Desulfobaculum bizertense DSM 18034 TaxID=1121442 RepID=A0A1T4VKR1_9BACT|nr:ABC transporter ATP-binding protein [Desulfobaculum bizertense]UIJ38098.1 ABC transporter ATP-binding protein [Desulfobaculum bizertense]SKA65552.1 heme exporter protein A [Desulfobaculum bizertense DSM 18034]
MMLRLNKLSKFYGSKLVLKNISFELPKGKVLLLVGENGAGKSTLLKVMSGLARSSGGDMECRVAQDKIAYVGHQTFIYPALTAMENLRFWAKLYQRKDDEDFLMSVLERVELRAAAYEEAGTFSRGMAQRLSLARVFMLEPELLFLDEPGTGLDQRSLGILHREIAAARERGATVVWVSHDVKDDLRRADMVCEIARHSLGYFGPAQDYTPHGAIVSGGDA